MADTHENAKIAARKVHIEYEELPAILSIQDAINARSFHPNTEKHMNKGDVDHCFQSGKCDRIIEGEVQIGGQEHFYLEPHGSLVWTLDGGNEVHMISSTQVSYTILWRMPKIYNMYLLETEVFLNFFIVSLYPLHYEKFKRG